MKSKLSTSLALFVCLSIIYITMSSKDDGYTSTSGTSCGSCHGNVSTETSVAFLNIPSPAIAGQVYTMQFQITHATLIQYGFNIFASGGTLTKVSTNTKVSGGQLTHSKVLKDGLVEFKWTAPTTPGNYELQGVGNAVNGDEYENADDKWNNTSASITVVGSTAVNDVKISTIKSYPNPATDYIVLEGITAQVNHLIFINLFGQISKPTYAFDGEKCHINVSHLSAGTYFVYALENGKKIKSMFVKN